MAQNLKSNPWVDIWLKPKETIRSIVSFNPKYCFVILSAIYGLPMVLNFAQSSSLIESLPFWAILVGALVVCPFIGALAIFVSSWLLHWTGKWIGGSAPFIHVRAAVAWSNVPNIVTIILWGLLIGVFGSMVFSKGFAEQAFVGYQAGIIFIVFLVETIISIWSFVILLKCLGQVQGFSAWKALLNVLIALVLVVVCIWALGWLISGINRFIS